MEDRFAKTADNVVETLAATVEPGSSAGSDTSTSSSGSDKTSKNAARTGSKR